MAHTHHTPGLAAALKTWDTTSLYVLFYSSICPFSYMRRAARKTVTGDSGKPRCGALVTRRRSNRICLPSLPYLPYLPFTTYASLLSSYPARRPLWRNAASTTAPAHRGYLPPPLHPRLPKIVGRGLCFGAACSSVRRDLVSDHMFLGGETSSGDRRVGGAVLGAWNIADAS